MVWRKDQTGLYLKNRKVQVQGNVSMEKVSESEEFIFWDRELSMQGEFAEFTKKRINMNTRHEEYPSGLIDPLFPLMEKYFPDETPYKVIELGSGPLSTLGHGVDKGVLDVMAVDPLADEFGMLYKKHKVTDFPIKPVRGSGETLDELFPNESFHLAYVRNALDHTVDIMLSLKNLVRTVKTNGFIILSHIVREGSRENWSEAHQWDLELTSNGLVAFDPNGGEFQLQKSNDLEFVHVYYESVYLSRWMNTIFKKTS